MRHVLVIEDAVLIRSVLRDALSREGYVVHEAVGVRDGLARYREVKPDVVTLDLTLPDGSGFECAEALRAEDPDARIVVVAAAVRDHIDRRLNSAGVAAFVAKPFRPHHVTEAIRLSLSAGGAVSGDRP